MFVGARYREGHAPRDSPDDHGPRRRLAEFVKPHLQYKHMLIKLPVLYIPASLIWKIRIRKTQKIVLTFSLCLTAIVVLITITRIAGQKTNSQIDQVWAAFFLTLAAEVGVILASVSTFRAFFVAHRKGNKHGGKESPGEQSPSHKQLFKRILTSSPWRSIKVRGPSTPEKYDRGEDGRFAMGSLRGIPRAHMTGVRTFINGRRKEVDPCHIMESQTIHEDGDIWPLRSSRDRSPENRV
ncbi:MAG: hypothetical protein Q9218_005600 [Villophora microphyllina]